MHTTTRSTKKRQNGSSASSQLDFFQPATWTPGPSKTLAPTISGHTLSATSSLVLDSGLLPSGRPDGPTTVGYGPDPAHASLSPRQAKAEGLMTSGTYGRNGIGSSSSSALQSSLESKLRARLSPTTGSTLYKMIWKEWDTPLGPSRSRLRAWARPISGIGYTGWPTPKVGRSRGRGRVERHHQKRLEDTIHVLLWPGGITRAGSIAATEQHDPLNPAFTLWLQGVPKVWLSYGPSAMASASRQPVHSSKPTSHTDEEMR